MLSILILIGSVLSPDMRERHWKQIKEIVKQDISYDQESFCFGDLMKLGLLQHRNRVEELLDQATKEFKIEKDINNINQELDTMQFYFRHYKESVAIGEVEYEEIIQTTDDYIIKLEAMLSSPFSDGFRDHLEELLQFVRTF